MWSARHRRSGYWKTPPAARRGSGSATRAERVQHRLEAGSERDQAVVILGLVGRLVIGAADLAEEVGGRQLPVVPGDDYLVPAHDGRNRVRGPDLTRLVEDHHVEEPGRREHLTDHER